MYLRSVNAAQFRGNSAGALELIVSKVLCFANGLLVQSFIFYTLQETIYLYVTFVKVSTTYDVSATT